MYILKVLILFFAALSVANAQVLLVPARDNPSCRGYRYKTPLGQVKEYQFISPLTPFLGNTISFWENDLSTFLNEWFYRFYSNGDAQFRIKSVCYSFIDDSESPNAFAYGTDAMLIGKSFVESLYTKMDLYIAQTMRGANVPKGFTLTDAEFVGRNAAYKMLLSHELGHLLQNNNQLIFPGPTKMMKELNADCIAGYLTTAEHLMNWHPGTTDPFKYFIGGSANAAFAYVLGDHGFEDVEHHGTPEERQMAFENGVFAAFNANRQAIRIIREVGFNSSRAAVLQKIRSQDVLRACAEWYPPLNPQVLD